MARNTKLPTVVREEKMPFVISSKNPTGVYSVAAIKRRQFLEDTTDPTVLCDVGTAERIAVFGDFKEISFNFDKTPKKMYAQSLICGDEQAIDLSNYLDGMTIKITQALLDEFNAVSDLSDNAVMFRFEF